MNNFDFQNKTKVIFGKDTESRVGEEVKKYSNKVLLHYGGGSIKTTGLYDVVIKSLKENGIEIYELSGVLPNPRVSLVREGIKLCKKENIGFILAVGGGSVIDSAKAIGVGLFTESDVWQVFDYKVQPTDMLPLGVVLTLPAAGSETSSSCVITNEDEKLKRGFGASFMRPKFAILNPELTFTLPAYQTSCGISDMFAHVMERYFVPTTNVDLTDRLCEATMKTIVNQAYKVMEDPNNYDARAEIMWCGTVAHNDILDTGRGGDWASHDIEHELSAMNDIAHGAGLSIVFPAWMKYVHNENIDKFVQFFTRVFDVENDKNSPENTFNKGILALEKFYKDINMPTRLSDVDFDISLIKEMSLKATFNGNRTLGSFKKLAASDIEEIYKLAI